MARKKRTRKTAPKAAATSQTPTQTRRDFLWKIASTGIGGVVVAGGGAAFAMDFRKKLAEQDLSVIGNGTPAIVQIHDPSCPSCAALQKETRSALRAFDPAQFNYRVANITTEAGSRFQGAQGLPHVTLARFNGAGERVHVVNGVQEAEVLIDAFQTHLALPTS